MKKAESLIVTLLIVQAAMFTPTLAEGVKVSEYWDGDSRHDKWYGSTERTYTARAYFNNGSYGSNWVLWESVGEDGNPNFPSRPPYAPMFSWHMVSDQFGKVYEVADREFNDDGSLKCEVVFEAGKEIRWGENGEWSVGSYVSNQLHQLGSCGENWGWNVTRMVAHYLTTITPPVSSPRGWSCNQTIWSDVIVLQNDQFYCTSAECTYVTQIRERSWNAKNFGVIKREFYEKIVAPAGQVSNPNKIGEEIIRLICNETTKLCGCPMQFPVGGGGNNPPNTPSNPNPANGATGVSTTPTLSWTGGDPDAGQTVTYDVYFGISATPPLVSSNQTATTYNPGTLNPSTTYFWQIVARDNLGATTSGPTWNFTTTAGGVTLSLSGQVTTGGGGGDANPLAGVTMTLTGAASATTTTDSNGNYTFTGLANGSYTITPSKTGYIFSPTSRSMTVNNANVTGQNFTATATGGGTPDLVISALSNPPASAAAGGSFAVTETTANQGTATAGASTTRYRLSLDSTITSADPLLTGSRAVPSLAAGGNSSGTTTVTIPTTLTPGTYYLGACADDLGAVAESNEANNCRASTTTIQVTGGGGGGGGDR